MTIEEFIEARLAEDEAIASAIPHGQWRNVIELGADLVLDSDNDMVTVTDDLRVNPHIARHDPARVLRQVAGLRRLVALTRRRVQSGWGEAADLFIVDELRPIAEAWADHPDYRPEWAPGQVP